MTIPQTPPGRASVTAEGPAHRGLAPSLASRLHKVLPGSKTLAGAVENATPGREYPRPPARDSAEGGMT